MPVPPALTLWQLSNDQSDRENHVYVSVGHGQMMTDAMKPLGLSVWQLTAGRPMYEAGGRLFVDVTQGLASPASRVGLLEVMGKGDPLIGDALQTILDRGDFIRSLPEEGPGGAPASGAPAPIETDPAIVAEWHHALMRVLVAARVNGPLAIDGPPAAFADLPGLERSARRTGLRRQVSYSSQPDRRFNRLYSPDPATYARAEGILSAYRQATDSEGRGAVRYEGEMIDEATRKMAESVARRGRWLGLTS